VNSYFLTTVVHCKALDITCLMRFKFHVGPHLQENKHCTYCCSLKFLHEATLKTPLQGKTALPLFQN